MTDHILEAQTRTEKGRKTNALRASGLVPAVVYGAGTEPQNVTVDRNALVKTYKAAGESTVVELKIDGANALHVLIGELQLDPLLDTITHADFRVVDMTQTVEAEVELSFVGEAMAVKGLGGTFVASAESVTVRALPAKLVRSVEVDISALATFDDAIRVSDLKMPEGMEVLTDADTTLAVVAPPRSEAEMEALDSAVEENVDAVEAAEKKESSEEEAAA